MLSGCASNHHTYSLRLIPPQLGFNGASIFELQNKSNEPLRIHCEGYVNYEALENGGRQVEPTLIDGLPMPLSVSWEVLDQGKWHHCINMGGGHPHTDYDFVLMKGEKIRLRVPGPYITAEALIFEINDKDPDKDRKELKFINPTQARLILGDLKSEAFEVNIFPI